MVHEWPNVFVETSKFFLHLEKSFGIVNSWIYFEFISDDTWVLKNFFNSGSREPAYLDGIKIRKRLSVALPFLQDCWPAQARLGAFQY